MNIFGPGGIGKSLLLGRMMTACRERGIAWVHIEWEDSRHYGYPDLMRRIRDGTDPGLFELFNDRLNFYTVPEYRMKIQLEGSSIERVAVLENGQVQQSGVTVHVGHSVQIADANLAGLRSDQGVSETEVMIQVTGAFVVCLQAFTAHRPLVLFLDGIEKMREDNRTYGWIKQELLERVRDAELTNLFIVIAGRESLGLDGDPSFFECAATYELKPFEGEHIREYLHKRGVTMPEFADWMVAQGETNPLQVALSVDNFVKYMRRESA